MLYTSRNKVLTSFSQKLKINLDLLDKIDILKDIYMSGRVI